jgi:arylsulfatase A-like enzyme
VAVLLLTGLVAPAPADPVAPPNIVLIKIEDTNDWVEGFGGHPDARTPNLLELASRGVRFVNAHTPSPLCNPAKTAILTGLAPKRTGVVANQQTPVRSYLPPHAKTLFEFFLDKGYYVAGTGLIFHQDYDTEAEPWSELPAYNWGRGVWPSTQLNGLPELLAYSGGFDWGTTGDVLSQWGDHQIVSWGIDFLNRTHDAPFVLALGFTMPHLQWWVPQSYWDQTPAAPALPPHLPGDRDDTPAYAQLRIDKEKHRIITEAGKWQEAIRAYLAAISFVDGEIGRLMQGLDNSPYADNTIVVFYSDHGFHLGEKDAWEKATLWEESTRVPFIVVAPGVPAGGVATKAASLLDIYPTLVELAGFEPTQQLDGVSLVGLLQDPVNGQRPIDHAVTSYYFGDSIRDERWRYTLYRPADPEEGGEELYDHLNDPDEHVNLAASAEHAAIRSQLAAELALALEFGPSLVPWLTITAPQDGAGVAGGGVVLAATALDPEDGDLSGAVEWSSDRDGALASPADLSPGPHVITAAVTDSDGQTVTRQVTVQVREARDDHVATEAGAAVVILPLANDFGFADPVTVQLVGAAPAGEVTVVGSPGGQTGISFEYAPPEGFTGVDTFGYAVDDGVRSDAATVEVRVQPASVPALTISAPQDGAQLTGEDVVLAATAVDAEDGDLSAAVTWSSDRDGALGSPADLSIGPHVITATVADLDGHVVSRQITVRVRDARDDAVETDAGVPVIIAALANDAGFADPVVVQIADPPTAGSVSVTGSPGGQGDIRLEYTPPDGFAGTAGFAYSVDDGTLQDTAVVQVLVRPSPLPSLAITAPQDGAQLSGRNVVLAATASDAQDGDLGAAVAWSSDVDGPLSSPAELSLGGHVITASVADLDGHVVTRQVAVQVREARDDYAETDPVVPVLVAVLANDRGFADPVTVQVTGGPGAGGAIVIGTPGNQSDIHLEYTPPAGVTGLVTFNYSVDDGSRHDAASVVVLVRSDADADGVDDSADNCLGLANTDQHDSSADGFGNPCDGDLDGDGMVNFADLALFRARFGSADADADFDGNGAVNFADLARFRSAFGRPPGPSAVAPP